MESYYPCYTDFGKSTKDFFTKGFQTGKFKLSIRDQMSKSLQATIQGTHNIEKKEADGDFQAKLVCPPYPGYLAITKWTTGNILTQEIHAKEAFQKGFDVGLEGNFNAENSSMTGKLLTAYRHPVYGTLDASFEGGDSSNPLLSASVVSGYQDFAAGYQFQLDTTEAVLKKNNVSASYVRDAFKFHTSLDNAELLWAGLTYKCNPYLEAGLTATYKSNPEGYYVFGTAVKYVLDCCTAIKAKFDSDLQFGLGFETKLRPTATITMSAQIDGNKLNEGGHKVGLSFDFEA